MGNPNLFPQTQSFISIWQWPGQPLTQAQPKISPDSRKKGQSHPGAGFGGSQFPLLDSDFFSQLTFSPHVEILLKIPPYCPKISPLMGGKQLLFSPQTPQIWGGKTPTFSPQTPLSWGEISLILASPPLEHGKLKLTSAGISA